MIGLLMEATELAGTDVKVGADEPVGVADGTQLGRVKSPG